MNTKTRRLALCIGLFILATLNVSAVVLRDIATPSQPVSKTYTYNNITTPVTATAVIQASAPYEGYANGTILWIVPGINGAVIDISASTSGSPYASQTVSDLTLPFNNCSVIHIGNCSGSGSTTTLTTTLLW